MTTMAKAVERGDVPKLFGHPAGLFTLFFAEMWERFSYYGMRALLVFYMIKGFLGFNDSEAYAVYGAYTALVYATPFIGGMLADRLLGARRAVVMGGLLMAAGHLLMSVEESTSFFVALALLIAGNGFFKPNISTIVGSLYPQGSAKRDAGFTIFYMGINLGAAIAPLLAGYIGETYGWHYGFGLATIGMLIGLAVFVMPKRVTQVLVLGGALATAIGLFIAQNNPYQLVINVFVGVALLAAGVIAFVALGRGGLPDEAGRPKDPAALTKKVFGPLNAKWAVYLGVAASIPLLALLVQRNTVAGWLLGLFGGVAFLWLLVSALKAHKVERERLFVVLILMFFSMLFWAFFEQAGSSINNFTDRNVDRVFEEQVVTEAQVGETLQIAPTQEQLGHAKDGKPYTLTDLERFRSASQEASGGLGGLAGGEEARMDWAVTGENVGMGLQGDEVPASTFQAANPIFILIFGLVFSALWGFLGARGIEPSTPVKFSLGLLQLGLGFGALWYGAMHAADARGMVAIPWLLLGYMLHTTGELCLSPVGLSMVTKLSPTRMVSTVMGAWFLATAFSNFLAGIIATFTGVGHGEGGETVIPPPQETVGVYGGVFGTIALLAMASAVLLFFLSPLLTKWMHEGEEVSEGDVGEPQRSAAA